MSWEIVGDYQPPSKERTPVQDVDIVTLNGMNWIEHHSVLTRSPVFDNGSGVINVRYSLAVDGEFIGEVKNGRLDVWLGLDGILSSEEYALCDKILISGGTTSGGSGLDIYGVNPEKQQTNQLNFFALSLSDGSIRGRVMIEIEFTLPNNNFGIGVLDW